MKSLKLSLLLAAALASSAGVQAQSAAAPAASTPTPTAPTEFTNAEVRKVDKEGKKITLKHGEIKNLGMPPMAMVFQLKDAAVLDKFKAGDKVAFKAIWEAGKYVVIDIQPAR